MDANGAPTPKVDRHYTLNPWLDKPGLDYSIVLGRGMSTDLMGDTKGVGSIGYVRLSTDRWVRVDTYAIPLKEINRKPGQEIRVGLSARSAVPLFFINSTGTTFQEQEDWCCGMPYQEYQRYVLKRSQSHEPDTVSLAATWSQETADLMLSQRITKSNERWFNSRSMGGLGLDRLEFPPNSPNAMRAGALHPQVIQEFLASLGIRPEQSPKPLITCDTNGNWINVEQNGTPPDLFEKVGNELSDYLRYSAGHTRDYLLASFRERGRPLPTNASPALKLFKLKHPDVPLDRIRDAGSGVFTNDNHEIYRWTLFGVVDGDLAWKHTLTYGLNDDLKYCLDERCDPKEFDPKYTNIIAEVARRIEAKMKQAETYRTLGACHEFWARKKELLKAKGVDWRSPSELNPNTNYD